MNQDKIGKFIANLRKSKNMTQEQMADKLGVSNKTVSRWENGRNLPDSSLFTPICDLLGISLTEFFAGEHIEQENIVQKAEESIVTTVEYTKRKTKRLTKNAIVIVIVVVILAIIVCNVVRVAYYSSLVNYSYNDAYYISEDYSSISYCPYFGEYDCFKKFADKEETELLRKYGRGTYIGNVAEQDASSFSKSIRNDRMFIVYQDKQTTIIRLENDFEYDYFYTNDKQILNGN